jgi:hypothetical protein
MGDIMKLTPEQRNELFAITKLSLDELDRLCAERMGWHFEPYNDGIVKGFTIRDPAHRLLDGIPSPTRDRADAWDLQCYATKFIGNVSINQSNDTTYHVLVGGYYSDVDSVTGIDRDLRVALCRAVCMASLYKRFYEEEQKRKRAATEGAE